MYSVLQRSACAFQHSVSQDGFFGLREGKDSLLPPLQKEQRANRSMSGRRRAYCKQSRRHEVPSALRETGTIARVPGTGRASKVTSEIRMVIEKQMEKNDESTGLELQKLLQKEVDGFDASLSLEE